MCICCAEHRKKKLASLDRIVADVRQQKVQYQEQQTITPEIALDHQHHTTQHADRDNVFQCTQKGSRGPPPMIGGVMHGEHARPSNKPLGMALPKFSFDDDSDLESPNRYVHKAFHTMAWLLICTVFNCTYTVMET